MQRLYGAEYLIGIMLVNKGKECKDQIEVSMDELTHCGTHVRHISDKEDIDVIFETFIPDIYNAICDFTDYFTCKYNDGKLTSVTINDNKQITDLEVRFIRRVPQNIIRVFELAMEELDF